MPKSTKYVIVLDPGITTGYANGLIENGVLGVTSGQSKWNELELYNELSRSKPDIVVYETFEYRNPRGRGKYAARDNVELFPRNLIGVINLYAHQRAASGNSIGLYTQSPAVGKSHYNDTKLRRLGVYKTGGPHANDAIRHLLQWWTFGGGFQYQIKGVTNNIKLLA